MSDTKTTLTEIRNGKNVIPLRNAICGIDMPYWCIEKESCNAMFLRGEAADKLAKYEESEAEGRMTVLPCKVGDTVYMPWAYDETKGISLLDVTHIIFDCEKSYIKTNFTTDDEAFWELYNGGKFNFEDFGKLVFLDYKEAEQELQKRQGESQ